MANTVPPDSTFIDYKATGENIKRLLQEKNISLDEVQEGLGLSTKNDLYAWMRGSKPISSACIFALCMCILKVPIRSVLVVDMNKVADILGSSQPVCMSAACPPMVDSCVRFSNIIPYLAAKKK